MSNESQTQALEVIDASSQLVVAREPAVVLAEAQKAATELQKVIASKPRKVMFNGEQYLEFEDWQTIARFYGITAKVVSTEFVDYGGVKGFSAKAVALRADGMEISAAEAECLNDEDKWRSRTKYEWRDNGSGGREKVRIGDEPVPLFQLKSMAQTRACGKALRNVLAWVVVLAGYKATPAEELDAMAEAQQHGNASTSKTTTAPTDGSSAPKGDGLIYVKKTYSIVRPSDEEKKAGKKAKPGKVILTDGREGTTFDDKHMEIAIAAEKDKKPVVATFEAVEGSGGRTYQNLKSIERVTQPELPVDDPDTEPVGQPEKIGFTSFRDRKAQGKTSYWEIGTDRRTYVTTDESVQKAAERLKAEGKKAIIEFRVLKGRRAVNEITKLTAAPDEATAASAEPKAEEAVGAFD